jgi:hypothetical protein
MVLAEKPEGKKEPLEDPGVEGRIIFRRIFRKWDGSMEWIDLAQDRKGLAGTCKRGNEPSGSVKCRKFLA